MFYNGSEMKEEHCILRLSDAYEQPCTELDLDLKVHVFHIGCGKNQSLLDACQVLKEYALYTERVRRYAGETILSRAVERAVKECIEEGILRDFLLKNRAEAIAVSIFEYDEKRELRLIRKEEYAEGLKEGRESGLKEGRESGLKEGRESGLKEGRSLLLQELIARKLRKGKNAACIAEELEEPLPVIEEMIRNMNAESPSGQPAVKQTDA